MDLVRENERLYKKSQELKDLMREFKKHLERQLMALREGGNEGGDIQYGLLTAHEELMNYIERHWGKVI
jgi:hypothetical protein